MANKYYSLTNILKMNAVYNMIIGERSNGKTFACFEYALKQYCEHGHQLALVRRWELDFTGKRGSQMFDAIVMNGLVEKYSKGKWTGIHYRASRWFLCKYDENLGKNILDEIPFAICNAMDTNVTPYLPIHPQSLRKTWQYDDTAYNFVLDFLLSMTPFNWERKLQRKLQLSRMVIGDMFTEEDLKVILEKVSPESVKRRMETKQLQKRYESRVSAWIK